MVASFSWISVQQYHKAKGERVAADEVEQGEAWFEVPKDVGLRTTGPPGIESTLDQGRGDHHEHRRPIPSATLVNVAIDASNVMATTEMARRALACAFEARRPMRLCLDPRRALTLDPCMCF